MGSSEGDGGLVNGSCLISTSSGDVGLYSGDGQGIGLLGQGIGCITNGGRDRFISLFVSRSRSMRNAAAFLANFFLEAAALIEKSLILTSQVKVNLCFGPEFLKKYRGFAPIFPAACCRRLTAVKKVGEKTEEEAKNVINH